MDIHDYSLLVPTMSHSWHQSLCAKGVRPCPPHICTFRGNIHPSMSSVMVCPTPHIPVWGRPLYVVWGRPYFRIKKWHWHAGRWRGVADEGSSWMGCSFAAVSADFALPVRACPRTEYAVRFLWKGHSDVTNALVNCYCGCILFVNPLEIANFAHC